VKGIHQSHGVITAVSTRIPLAAAHLPRRQRDETGHTHVQVRVAGANHIVRRKPPVVAKDNGEWKVNGDLIGKKDKVAEDLSGIACTTDSGFPRTCLLIDDEQQSAQVVTLSDGEITAGR
jgi:hypothetical protein